MSKLIFVGLLLFSCHNISKPDWEKERKEILRLESKQRAYHFAKDAKAFTDMFSKDFLSVNKGTIETPTSENSYQKFNAWFNSVEFVKWDDNTEPLVRFSDDASVAYVAVNKLVVIKKQALNAKQILDTTNFAWLTVYKKYNGEWKIDCVSSTNK